MVVSLVLYLFQEQTLGPHLWITLWLLVHMCNPENYAHSPSQPLLLRITSSLCNRTSVTSFFPWIIFYNFLRCFLFFCSNSSWNFTRAGWRVSWPKHWYSERRGQQWGKSTVTWMLRMKNSSAKTSASFIAWVLDKTILEHRNWANYNFQVMRTWHVCKLCPPISCQCTEVDSPFQWEAVFLLSPLFHFVFNDPSF